MQPVRGTGSVRGRGRGSRMRRGWIQPREEPMQVSVLSSPVGEVRINGVIQINFVLLCFFKII